VKGSAYDERRKMSFQQRGLNQCNNIIFQ